VGTGTFCGTVLCRWVFKNVKKGEKSLMNFSGTLITLEIATDGLVLCHLGTYEKYGDIKIKAKFWASNVPMEKVVSFYATAVRTLTGTDHNNCQDVILDIKDFTISGDIVDGMILNSYYGVV
jgi:hypothetical protein